MRTQPIDPVGYVLSVVRRFRPTHDDANTHTPSLIGFEPAAVSPTGRTNRFVEFCFDSVALLRQLGVVRTAVHFTEIGSGCINADTNWYAAK